MSATTEPLTAARAAALFVSDLSTTDDLTTSEVAPAIRHALRTHGGTRGCAADVAYAYGDHPELAAPRMRWARSVIECLYQKRVRPGARPRSRPTTRYRRATAGQRRLTAAA
jgi:hypothetical protein